MRIGKALFVGIFFCAVALAQKPDFTGVWKHSVQDSSTTYTIQHRDPNLTILFKYEYSAAYLAGSGTRSYTESHIIDGVEKDSKTSTGRESWTSVSWQGDALVVVRVVKDGYRVSVTREAWTLSQDGRTLSKNRRVINMDAVTEDTEVFLKQ